MMFNPLGEALPKKARTGQNFSPFICPHGKDHTPNPCDRRKELRNWLFQAAYQGCKPCVSHCIGEIGIDPGTQSYQRKHTAMTWAKWGREQGIAGTDEVIAYLASLVPDFAQSADASEDPTICMDDFRPESPYICPHGKDHTPRKADQRQYTGYWMFQAASQGCKTCVQHCIDVKRIDPNVQSRRRKYTAMSWATWGREQQVEGTEEVVAYLASLASESSAKRPRVYNDKTMDDVD